MSTAQTQFLAEMASGNTETATEVVVTAFSNGWVRVCVQPAGDDHGEVADTGITLGQAIQLRDFLNRHIDELALKQTGSLAERSADDPAQLAAVEEVCPLQESWVKPSSFGQAPVARVIPVDEEAEAVLLGKISVLAVQASDVFDQVNGALQLAGHASDENVHASAHPQRWLQSARMDVQTGLMKLERAVKNPANW